MFHTQIAGIDDPGEGWTERESENGALERLAAEIPDDLPRLLLAHRPSYFTHASRLGFPLVLSGHTHGGQIGFEWGPLRWSVARFMYTRWAGLYEEPSMQAGRKQHLYINRGIGTIGPPLRFGIRPEITLLTLRKSA